MIRNTQIIFCNYAVALFLCYLFFDPTPSVALFEAHWPVYVPLMVLLPSVFLFLAASIKHVGIVRTDAAQRLSLFIPILAAWFIFKEDFNTFKIIGLLIGFPALALILAKKTEGSNDKQWVFPAIVLLGFGVVDTLFKKVVTFDAPNYTTSLFMVFIGAITITFFAMLYEIFILKKTKFSFMNIAYGALVGIFNFGNILFYLQAHKEFADNPSTVFAAMNMGVIVAGSLAGVLIFDEKLRPKNFIGIMLALVAIVFIALSQLYA
jgi:drug/metabolite transporter (DMT)-like permease